jgi:hypothetical protein
MPDREEAMQKETIRIERKEIDENRAAALLGFNQVQLGQLCAQSGLGRKAEGDASERRWFTYQELCQLCRWAMRPAV